MFLFLVIACLAQVRQVIALGYLVVHVYFDIDFFIRLHDRSFVYSVSFLSKLSLRAMLRVWVSFILSINLSEDVIEDRKAKINLVEVFLNNSQVPKRRKNKGSDHIDWIMNSGNRQHVYHVQKWYQTYRAHFFSF